MRRILLLGLVVAALVACSSEEGPKAKGPKRGGMRVSPAATVQPYNVKSETFEARREYGGTFVSDAMADISAEVSGTVRGVKVRLGDRVEKGDVLANIDPLSYRQRVKELEASVALSKASIAEAEALKMNLEADLKRKRPLLDRQLVTEREIEDLESQVAIAQQRLDVARATRDQNAARLSAGRDSLSDTRVKAPFSGIIAERYVDIGNHVNPGQNLFRLVDDTEIYLRLRIAEHDSGLVVPDMPVSIRVDALGGKLLTGKIHRIAPAVDPTTRTMRVDVQAANPEEWERVKPGMYARAQLIIANKPNAIVVPSQAVHKQRDGARYVWTVKDGKAAKTPVVPGVRDRDRQELLEGLSDGDVIVLRGHEKVKDGGDVQLVGEISEGKK